ncbi:MAG: IS66 family transposase [Acidiferrobacterales bacterium]
MSHRPPLTVRSRCCVRCCGWRSGEDGSTSSRRSSSWTSPRGASAGSRRKKRYFWPITGEDNEIVFPFATSRSHSHVPPFLGSFAGTLLSDGYEAYAAYARNHAGVIHAVCPGSTRTG